MGCYDKCLEILRFYWGGMVKAGADTFWECYDPADAWASPYGDVRTNSFCHARSCTPTILLRTQLFDKMNGMAVGKITLRELDNDWVKQSASDSSSQIWSEERLEVYWLQSCTSEMYSFMYIRQGIFHTSFLLSSPSP